MAVTAEGFAYMIAALARTADEAGAPIGMVLEGGYDLGGLEACLFAATRALVESSAPDPRSRPISGRHRVEIQQALASREGS